MAPRIVVCVAAALARESPPPFEPGQGGEASRVLNPADEHAIEEALRLRDAHPATRITALTVGQQETDAVLRSCLVAGADDAVRAWDDSLAEADTLATAGVLAAVGRRLAADLVLCGVRAGDGDTGVTPVQLSELLGWPLVLEGGGVEVRDKLLYAERREGAARRSLVRCPLPAVVTIAAGSNRLRYPRLRNRLRASEQPIETWGRVDLGLKTEAKRLRIERIAPPKPKRQGLLGLDSALSAEERWQAVIGGGIADGRREETVVRGSPPQLARHFLRLLRELHLR